MSDIRFWDSERTASEINANKNSVLNTNSNLKLYYKLTDGSGSAITDSSGNSITGTATGTYQWIDSTPPSVSLSDSDDEDNIVSHSHVVTITATFSESMSATPTISLSGIVSNIPMTASSSLSQWIYTWIVSGTSVSSTTATVSGTDLAGNYLSGSDSITFTIDNNGSILNLRLNIIKLLNEL